MRNDAPVKGKSGLNRLNDRLFKYIFASRQHKANLIRFLNDVLDDPDIRRILNMEEAFVKTPELWVNYLIREREQSDWDNYVRSMAAKGEARGEARGKAEGIAFVVCRMLARGLLTASRPI